MASRPTAMIGRIDAGHTGRYTARFLYRGRPDEVLPALAEIARTRHDGDVYAAVGRLLGHDWSRLGTQIPADGDAELTHVIVDGYGEAYTPDYSDAPYLADAFADPLPPSVEWLYLVTADGRHLHVWRPCCSECDRRILTFVERSELLADSPDTPAAKKFKHLEAR